jgi:glutaredoxin 2
MEPLNSAERTTALLKFFGLFLVTVILVCVAMFFDVITPSTQIKNLKAENQRLTDLNAQSALKLIFIDSIQKNLDRYDIDTMRQTQIEIQINQCIVNLQTLTAGDSSVNSAITKDAAVISASFLNAKKRLKECANSSSIIATYKQQLAELQKKYDDTYRDYALYMRSNGMPVK